VAASALGWALLSERLGLRPCSSWLGFALLFVNFGVARWLFGLPVLTDAWGFALGMGQAFGLFCGWRWRQLLLALVAFFVWPQAGVAGLLLFLFPRSSLDGAPAPRKATTAALVAATLLMGRTLTLHLSGHSAMPFGGQQLHPGLLPLSLVIAGAYVVVVMRRLLDVEGLWEPRRLLDSVRPWTWAVVAAVAAGVGLAGHALGRDARSQYPSLLVSAASFLDWSVFTSVTLPGLFLVAHTVFFGPGFLLIGLFFRPFCEAAHRLGPGATLYVTGSLLFLLNASSRVSFAAWPMLIAVLMQVLDQRVTRRGSRLAIGTAALVLARPLVPIWPLMATASFKEAQVPGFIAWMRGWLPIRNIYGGTWRFLDFPHQYFHMTNGPWMSVEMYFLQGLAVVLLALGLRLGLLPRPRAWRA
jgi:hypothetical protein